MLTTSSVQLHSNCRFFQSLLDSVIRTWDLGATGEAHLHNNTGLLCLDFMYVVLIRGSFRGFYHSQKSYEEKKYQNEWLLSEISLALYSKEDACSVPYHVG